MTTKEPFYTDFDFRLNPNPLTGDLANLTDLDCIKRSLKTICTWQKWDYPFNPTIHNYLTDQLFDTPSLLTSSNIQSRIQWLITNYEPRVLIQNINIMLNSSEDGYSVTIYYIVKSILQQGVVSFSLNRVR